MAGSAAAPGAQRPLRVALVGDYPNNEDAILQGGVQSVTHALAHALSRRADVECHVVSAVLNPETDYRKVGPLHVHYVKRLPLPRAITCKLTDSPALSRAVRNIKPDIVHGQGQDRHALGALNAGYPTVITPHGVLFVETKLLRKGTYDLLGMATASYINSWEREVFRRADHMILISSYLKEIYGDMLTAPHTSIDNPINASYFDLPRDPQPNRLLFVGVVAPRKCVHDLVAAAGHLRDMQRQGGGTPNFEFRIAGPLINPAVEQKLRDMIRELQLEAHVKLLGALSEDDLRDEYSKAQLLLLASREETSPQVIAQAMACGLPTVASRSGGIPAMIDDGETGLLFPFADPAACARQIDTLLRDRDRWTRMSDRIRVEARRRFHSDSVAASTVDVYRGTLQAVGDRRRRA